MTWETKITRVKPNELLIRGYRLDELIGTISYAAGVYLLLKGQLPNKSEEKMINAILVSSMDHGVTPPSAVTARSVASCGVPITTAMAAGILSIGDYHGGAGEKCMTFLIQAFEENPDIDDLTIIAKNAVQKARQAKKRIQGFGHRIHTKDPRATKLLKIATEEKIRGKYVDLALEIEKQLKEQTGRDLPVNVDGMIGAILADMGFDYRVAKAIFAISRVAGVTAHIIEEIATQRPMRTIIPKEAEYTGPEPRSIPNR